MTEPTLQFLGEPLARARVALVMIHGRGADAASILELSRALLTSGVTYLAPQAPGNAWYPQRFMEALDSNEPHLSNALGTVAATLAQVARAGIAPERTVLLGFSQGACLATEFAARNARRYGGLIGLSGGLIGPDGTPRDYAGSLAGTPVFLGCSDVDAHIPQARVLHTAEVLQRLGGDVTTRLYPNMGHLVNDDELVWVRGLLAGLVSSEQ